MKVLIVSDLHIDVNQWDDFKFEDKINKVDATLIAGDIAGDWQNEKYFLDKLKEKSTRPIIAVGGNHLGYNYLYRNNRIQEPLNGTKEYCINKLCNTFDEGNTRYLENDYIKIKDKIIFGGTMYTDFNLYGNAPLYSQAGERGLNDFRLVHTYDGEVIRPVNYEDYMRWFKIFMARLNKCIEETTEDIIVLTHFAPSVKSISEKYNGRYRDLNPSYAVSLEEFIIDNPRIKLWVHGHMHDTFDYRIEQCRVVCNPFGYMHQSNIMPQDYNGKCVIVK